MGLKMGAVLHLHKNEKKFRAETKDSQLSNLVTLHRNAQEKTLLCCCCEYSRMAMVATTSKI